MGAEADIIAYLTSPYFGLRAFGEIYGYAFVTSAARPVSHDDVCSSAGHDGFQFRLFGLRYPEPSQRLLQVVQEASHSGAVIIRSRCESSIERPVYFCGPPAAQQTISVTRYLNPAGDTR
jgi:hypothetical protein